jgi:hypothetical protein
MSKSRVSIFGDDGDTAALDVSAFAPKVEVDRKAPPADQVKAVSNAANFKSREPTPVNKPNKRAPRRYRTGRNVQVSIKALAETVDQLYAITDKHGWVLGFTLQRAIDALQRELKQSQ